MYPGPILTPLAWPAGWRMSHASPGSHDGSKKGANAVTTQKKQKNPVGDAMKENSSTKRKAAGLPSIAISLPLPAVPGNGNAASPHNGALSAPSMASGSGDQTVAERPRRCPLCNHSAVSRWQPWIEHGGEWIWHCHYVSRQPHGAPFCGHMWRTSRPGARCGQCGLLLVIEQHNSVIGYWCGFCQDFSQ